MYRKKNHRYFSVCFSQVSIVRLEKLSFRICFYSVLLYKEDIVQLIAKSVASVFNWSCLVLQLLFVYNE